MLNSLYEHQSEYYTVAPPCAYQPRAAHWLSARRAYFLYSLDGIHPEPERVVVHDYYWISCEYYSLPHQHLLVTPLVAILSSPIMTTNSEDIKEALKAVLLARVDNIDQPPHILSSPIAIVASKTTQQLRIVLISPSFDKEHSESPSAAVGTKRWDAVQRTLTYVYVQAMKVAQEMDRILMDVDVLLKGEREAISEQITADAEVIYRSEWATKRCPSFSNVWCPSTVGSPDSADTPPGSSSSNTTRTIWLAPGEDSSAQSLPPPSIPTHDHDPELPIFFPVVASGGTFDHLHAGHKILLSMAAWIAQKKLIVGVTGTVVPSALFPLFSSAYYPLLFPRRFITGEQSE